MEQTIARAETVPATMTAVTLSRYGSSHDFEVRRVPCPTPQAGEVLIRVRAAAAHRGDVHLMTGRPYLIRLFFGLRRPRHPVLGQEVAGTVVAVGEGVTEFCVGDDVFGPVGRGAYAEFVSAPVDKLLEKPAGLDFATAATIGDSAMTALQAVRDIGGVKAGDQVLVNGASGGVGTFAVQIAKALGAEVTAVCSVRHADCMRSRGVDRVVDYAREDFTELRGYDVLLDLVGNRSIRHGRRVLKRGGTFVSCAGPKGDWIGPLVWFAAVLANHLFSKHAVRAFVVQYRRDDLRTLLDLVVSGRVEPVIEQSLPLLAAADALRHLAEGHAEGKTVLQAE